VLHSILNHSLRNFFLFCVLCLNFNLLINTQSLENKPDDCQKLIDMGMDPSEPCGDVENGDGENKKRVCDDKVVS
jgi:hypothetical protein